jgi:hypothetical protein
MKAVLLRGLLPLLVVLSVPQPALAQATLSGRVVTGDDPRPVPNAVIAIAAARTVTGADGTFSIAATLGPNVVDVSAAGYLPQRLTVVVVQNMPPIELLLVASPSVREDVRVVGSGGQAPAAPSSLEVPPTAVLSVAGAADNIFRTLMTLPGVNGTDDFGSRLSVRGGGPDQNLTVMDGVEIHNPYRLFGLTSAFNPETVARFELTAGGFDARYGDRLSSILVVENRAGAVTEPLTGSAAVSFTDANVVLEGKLPGGATGSWLITGRRTYYDLIADKITNTDLPSFSDVQAKGVWEMRPGHRLTFFGLRSREKTDATLGSRTSDYVDLGDVSRNDVASVTYGAVLGRSVGARTIVAWYDYHDALDVDGSVSDGARRSNAPGRTGERRATIVFTRDLGVRDLSLRQ